MLSGVCGCLAYWTYPSPIQPSFSARIEPIPVSPSPSRSPTTKFSHLVFIEDFSYASHQAQRWLEHRNSGASISFPEDKLQVLASRNSGVGMWLSQVFFNGNIKVRFIYSHSGSGRTTVGLVDGSSTLPDVKWSANLDLDTDDTAYLNFSCGAQTTQYKHSSSGYLNRFITVDFVVDSGIIDLYIDGAFMEKMSFPQQSSYRLAIAVSSVPWKSGNNVSSFDSIKVYN